MQTRSLPVFSVEPATAAGGAVVSAAGQLAEAAVGPRDIRAVKTLRLSITDRCNLRCVYCMPEEGLRWLPREDLLSFEEIVEVARAALRHGIRDFKITGGEPLLRTGVVRLVEMLRGLPGCGELSLTTNGMLLERDAAPLAAAGLNRVTVSLDTLDADRFRRITRTGELDEVLRGIAAAERAGLGPVKINSVVMRGENDDEVEQFAALTIGQKRTVRFIEFMPLGRSKLLTRADHFVPYQEIVARIEGRFGRLEPADRDAGSGPARVFRIRGAAGKIGFIHAMSQPFCATCNRLRLTPEGQLRSCLFDGGEVDVRPLVRPVPRPERLHRAFVDCVRLKPEVHQPYGERQMSSIGG